MAEQNFLNTPTDPNAPPTSSGSVPSSTPDASVSAVPATSAPSSSVPSGIAQSAETPSSIPLSSNPPTGDSTSGFAVDPNLAQNPWTPAPPTQELQPPVSPSPIGEPPDPYAAVSASTPTPDPNSVSPSTSTFATPDPASSGIVATMPSAENVVTSQGSAARKKVLFLVGGLVLVVIVIIVGGMAFSSFNSTSTSTATTPAATEQPTEQVTEDPSAVSPTEEGPTSVPTTEASPTSAGVLLPADVPAYTGTTPVNTTGTKRQLHSEQKTADASATVVTFYKSELEKNGWTKVTSTKEGQSQKITALKGDREIVVRITPSDGQTVIGIVITNVSQLGNTGSPAGMNDATAPAGTDAAANSDTDFGAPPPLQQ